MYVDDIITITAHRSMGYGTKLLSWLKEQLAKEGCEQMHLDSGNQRKEHTDSMRREGMTRQAFASLK